jgi:hypothetical protein
MKINTKKIAVVASRPQRQRNQRKRRRPRLHVFRTWAPHLPQVIDDFTRHDDRVRPPRPKPALKPQAERPGASGQQGRRQVWERPIAER